MRNIAESWSGAGQDGARWVAGETSSPRLVTFVEPFDDAGPVQRWCARVVASALVVGGALLTPVADTMLLPIPGYMAAFGSAMLVINVLLAALLFARGAIDGQASAVRLGTAYFFVALMILPLLAAFPGVFLPRPLIGTQESAVWLWSFWHMGFGLCIVRYAVGGDRVRSPVVPSALVTLGVALLLTLVSTAGLPYLPDMLVDGHRLFSGFGVVVVPATLAVLSLALTLVLRSAPSAERRWVAVALVAAGFDVWLTYRGMERYSFGWYLSKGGSLLTSLAVLISQMHDIAALHSRVAAANEALVRLAHRDGLTGLANRRRFDELIDVEWRRARRDKRPITLAMIDVDHFKAFNDRYGHLQGDECLRQIANILQAVARRPGDCAARYGGEEFVLVLPATDAVAAANIAAQVHARLRYLALPHAASGLGFVTISIGMSTMTPAVDTGHDLLLGRADDNLYVAKAAGRNRTESDEVLVAP